MVRWNEPFQKLATCDMEGGIFVWIQYEGRWSVELVNDRGAQVSNESPGNINLKLISLINRKLSQLALMQKHSHTSSNNYICNYDDGRVL